jgi:dTMP kinase
MNRGVLIVIEGIDGSGSTTVATALRDRLGARRRVALTAEPSPGPVGVLIRKILQHEIVVPTRDGEGAPDWCTMALLFAADRLEHTESVIRPALASGQVVVCDRYTLSSLLYQSLTSPLGEASLPWLAQINAHALAPDLTVVLDVSAEAALARRRGRVAQELFELDELQVRLAAEYARAERYLSTENRVQHVDAGRPLNEVIAHAELAALAVLRDA